MTDNEKMPNNSLTALFDHAEKFVTQIFAEQGEFMPQWICDTSAGERIVLMTPIPAPEYKNALAMTLKDIFQEHGVVRAIFACEAWTLPLGMIKSRDQIPRGGLANHPDRIEILQMLGQDDEGNNVMAVYEIKRDREKPYLANRKVTVNWQTEGRFQNLIQQRSRRAQ